MGILERIKRRQYEGFKEFVTNLETTPASSRQQIYLAAILEDPIYMSHVSKNLKNFSSFLDLPTGEVLEVLKNHEQIPKLLAKSLVGIPPEKSIVFQQNLGPFRSQVKDEIELLGNPSNAEIDGARNYLIGLVRKLQNEEQIYGFGWSLPPLEIFSGPNWLDGKTRIYFENGVLAAEGVIQKNRRTGTWKHFYDHGPLLAEGEYFNGFKNGLWKFFYTDGKMKSQGEYFEDERVGIWEEWDKQGLLKKIKHAEHK